MKEKQKFEILKKEMIKFFHEVEDIEKLEDYFEELESAKDKVVAEKKESKLTAEDLRAKEKRKQMREILQNELEHQKMQQAAKQGRYF